MNAKKIHILHVDTIHPEIRRSLTARRMACHVCGFFDSDSGGRLSWK